MSETPAAIDSVTEKGSAAENFARGSGQLGGRILVAGTDTLIGRALAERLKKSGNIVIDDSDLLANMHDRQAVDAFFAAHKPDYVFCMAGKTAGIAGNQKYPATLLLDNVDVTVHVLTAAQQHDCKRLLYMGSSCAYPVACEQPMREESLFTGAVEPTSRSYATAKLMGMQLCEAMQIEHGCDFFVAIPANYFGPGDAFDPENSHVIEALMRRMHDAKVSGLDEVAIWGTGNARREFLCADELASAAIHCMVHYKDSMPINLGGGVDISIRELAVMIKDIVGYGGALTFDTTKPDGAPLKALNAEKLFSLGWKPETDFLQSLKATYEWFVTHNTSTAGQE